jgi:hypothetical protein
MRHAKNIAVKFDGHCPSDHDYGRPTIRKFRDEYALVTVATHVSGRKFYSAAVRGCRVDCCNSLKQAVQWAATEAANIQINVTTIRST